MVEEAKGTTEVIRRSLLKITDERLIIMSEDEIPIPMEEEKKEDEELKRRREVSLEKIRNYRDYRIDKQAECIHVEALEKYADKIPQLPRMTEEEKMAREEARQREFREVATCEAMQSKNVVVYEDVRVVDPGSKCAFQQRDTIIHCVT